MRIYINQLGYQPGSRKTAVLVEEQPGSRKTAVLVEEQPGNRKTAVPAKDQQTGQGGAGKKIRILDVHGRCVLIKDAIYFGTDKASGDQVWQADFSELTEEGCYRMEDGLGNVSCSFRIAADIYAGLNRTLCKAFYFQRCGMPLEEKHAGIFKRESCHEEKAVLLEEYLEGNTEHFFDVRGGWHDAGDYGRYTTAAATALAHMLYAWEWFPDSFQESLNIPESGNGMDDILNECLYELKWLLKMQMEDGSVRHKLTSMRHANFVMPAKDKRQMILFPPSTMAAGDFAAIMAMASRVYARFDSQFSETAFEAARKAWDWLEAHPEFIGFNNPQGCNTGEYEDNDDQDERLWAAAELYRCTKDAAYLSRAEELLGKISKKTSFGWTDVAGLAGWALLEEDLKNAGSGSKISSGCEMEAAIKFGKPVKEKCGSEAAADCEMEAAIKFGKPVKEKCGSETVADCEMEARLKKQYIEYMICEAEQLVSLCKSCGYMVAMEIKDYEWGSNMVLMNRGMLLALSYLLSGREEFLDCTVKQMDYLLGVNATGYSYVTGAGEHAFHNPHNRVTVADGIEETIPGFVSGGANSQPVDEKAEWLIEPGTAPMKCYLDIWECYSLNEITIYWNSPAVFLAAFLGTVYR